jgi:acyl dehydratase
MEPMPLAAMRSLVGREIGVSDWIAIEQDRNDGFSVATDDFAAVHRDPAAARAMGLDDTFAQGFLTLSMLMRLQEGVLPEPAGMTSGFNYGFDRIRFLAPVLRGARIRARFVLTRVEEVRPGGWQRTVSVTVEIEGEAKPALVAEWIGYFTV